MYSPAPSGTGITGTGSYLPERIVSNETAARAGATADGIERKTGIRERRYAADHAAASDLATEGRRAGPGRRRGAAGGPRLDRRRDLHPRPSAAGHRRVRAARLGARRAAAFGVNAVCAGFIAALDTGSRLPAVPGTDGRRRPALVIGSEVCL